MINLSYLTDHILYEIFMSILSIFLKNMEKRLIIFNKNIRKQNRKQNSHLKLKESIISNF